MDLMEYEIEQFVYVSKNLLQINPDCILIVVRL